MDVSLMEGEGTTPKQVKKATSFSLMLAVVQLLLLISFFFLGTAPHVKERDPQVYNYLIGVGVMMLIGFGYLMTFLRWYGLGAVGLTLLITSLGVQSSLIFEPLFSEASWSVKIEMDVMALLNAELAVAAFLISFGALLGKLSPKQLVVLVIWESLCYCAHKKLILERWLDVKDCGGTIIIHMFGAYFGLACAYVLGPPSSTKKEKASIVSDLTSLIGTTFLWVYWPSFVAGILPPGVPRELALTNTLLALTGSTVSTFVLSPLLSESKIRPVDIQNAALAGGVSIGAVANLPITPFGAVLIGVIAGLLSTIGFCRVMEFAASKGLHDTCGVHNLHGMPSVLGGLVSALVPCFVSSDDAGYPGTQLAGVVLTVLLAVIGGTIAGAMLRPLKDEKAEMGEDAEYWEVAEEQT